MEPQGGLRGQQPGNGAQVPTGAEHLQHPMAPGGQPAVDPATGRNGPLQQGAVEVGDQHQFDPAGQGRGEMALKAGPGRPSAVLHTGPPDGAGAGVRPHAPD